MNPSDLAKFPCVIRPLSEEEGGGYLAMFPDLPLVMSDGDTPTEALANGLDALKCALEALGDRGVYRNSVTGKFVAQTTHKNSRATSKRTKKV